MEFGWINFFGGIIVILILIPNIVYAVKKEIMRIPRKAIPRFYLFLSRLEDTHA